MPLLPKAKLAQLSADARTEKAERDARGDYQRDTRPLPPMGIVPMVIKSITAKTTSKGGHVGIETHYEEQSGLTATVKDWKILKSGGDYNEDSLDKNWKFFIKRWINEFDYDLPEVETVEELALKLQVFVGRSVKVAVQHVDSIWYHKKENKYEKQTDAYPWYTGSMEKEMFYNAAEGHRGLSAADAAKVGQSRPAEEGAAPAATKTAEEAGDPYVPVAGNGPTPSWMKQNQATGQG